MKGFLSCLISLALASTTLAQSAPKIRAFAGNASRSIARVLYFDPETRGFPGGFSISYGLPKWKGTYEDPATFDTMTKGKTWRLGEGIWTTLDTNVKLRFGNRTVAPGIYYLGLRRSMDDKWTLEFYQPAAIHAKHLDAAVISQVPEGEFNVPLNFTKTDKLVEALAMSFDYPKEDPTKVTLHINWGKIELSTPIDVILK